ncbi:MAG: ATP-binding protein, partial [bacterium]|nr:ATP-binding protein [bacterium]
MRLRDEMEKYFDRIKGQYAYDCVLGLSGGKDSSYLLYHLIKVKKMKVLAVHINMHFESRVAEKNIEALRKRLDFDLETVDPGFEFYRKFFRTLFLNPNKAGYLKSICYTCGPLNIGFCLKTAVDRKIPLVLLAFSPNQPEDLFFEWGREIIRAKDWIP